MILFIDTTDFNKVTYALIGGLKVKRRVYKIDPHRSHETLQKLGHFFKQFKIPSPTASASQIRKSKISKIVVNKGPGSYTGTRVGVTHALALGFAWNIPVKPMAARKIPKDLTKLK